jgi:hypothetical protein
MPGFLSVVSRKAHLIDDSLEPYDLHGGRPVPGILTKTVEDVENFARRGSPVSLSDLVSSLSVIERCSPQRCCVLCQACVH